MQSPKVGLMLTSSTASRRCPCGPLPGRPSAYAAPRRCAPAPRGRRRRRPPGPLWSNWSGELGHGVPLRSRLQRRRPPSSPARAAAGREAAEAEEAAPLRQPGCAASSPLSPAASPSSVGSALAPGDGPAPAPPFPPAAASPVPPRNPSRQRALLRCTTARGTPSAFRSTSSLSPWLPSLRPFSPSRLLPRPSPPQFSVASARPTASSAAPCGPSAVPPFSPSSPDAASRPPSSPLASGFSAPSASRGTARSSPCALDSSASAEPSAASPRPVSEPPFDLEHGNRQAPRH
mmetsp:Transcript_5839/g.11772  ORF Transcript_5839/g.11772 Transcript_5839/m.11772 type:complete len:290 (+) Transcript_5839:57-926(+)